MDDRGKSKEKREKKEGLDAHHQARLKKAAWVTFAQAQGRVEVMVRGGGGKKGKKKKGRLAPQNAEGFEKGGEG